MGWRWWLLHGRGRGTLSKGVGGGVFASNNIVAIGGDSRAFRTNNTSAFLSANGFATWTRRYLPGKVDFNRGMVFAVGNTSIADFVADQMPGVLASAAGSCILISDLNGIDDVGNTLEDDQAAFDTVVAAFSNARKKLFVSDGLPVGSVGAAATWQAALRDHIRTLDDPDNGIYVVPTWDALATVADGHTAIADTFPAGDSVHPNSYGCSIIAHEFATVMAPIMPDVDLFAPTLAWGGDFTSNGGTVTAPATGVAVDNMTLAMSGTGTVVGSVEDADDLHWQVVTMSGTDALSFTFQGPELISYFTAGTDYLDFFIKVKLDAGSVGINRLWLYALTDGGTKLFLGDGDDAVDGFVLSTDLLPPTADEFTLRLPHVFLPSTATTLELRVEATTRSGVTSSGVIKFAFAGARAYTGTLTEPPLYAGSVSDLAAVAASATAVDLTFTASTDATSHQSRYSLADAESWSSPATIASGGGAITGLTAETAYDFQVRGVNAWGNGAWSNVATETTEADASLDPFALTYRDSVGDTASLTTYTFSGRALGAAPTGANVRYILIPVATPGGTQTVSSMTVGGVSAALVSGAISSAGGAHQEIWIANVPTGTTGDVVVTWSAAIGGCGIGVYSLLNPASSTATDTATAIHSSGVVTLTLDIPTGGAAIAVTLAQETVLPTITWTGTASPSENYDFDADIGDAMSGAIGTTAGTNVTFIATSSDTTPSNMRGVAASWGP